MFPPMSLHGIPASFHPGAPRIPRSAGLAKEENILATLHEALGAHVQLLGEVLFPRALDLDRRV